MKIYLRRKKMNIFLKSVAIIFASYIIFGGKKSAITLIALIALIGLLITIYLTNKHLFALEFSRICSPMRRAISNMKLLLGSRKLAVEIDKEMDMYFLLGSRKLAVETDKETDMKLLLRSRKLAVETDKETDMKLLLRLAAHTKIIDFFTNKLEGETKKSDDKEKAIHLGDDNIDNIFHLESYNIFENFEYADKEKEIYLVEYSYRWYLGLRAKNIFEEKMYVLQDFLNHIWNCYGVFSANKLSSMLYIESINIRYNIGRYLKKIRIDNFKHYNFIQNFYSYHNKTIEIYLPTNVVLTISDNGLYEIVRFA